MRRLWRERRGRASLLYVRPKRTGIDVHFFLVSRVLSSGVVGVIGVIYGHGLEREGGKSVTRSGSVKSE